MTAEEKVIRRKLSLLKSSKALKNVTMACRSMGYSRQQFHEIRRDDQTHGIDSLIDKLPGAKRTHPARVDKETEKTILDYALEYPTHGPLRIVQELQLKGIQADM